MTFTENGTNSAVFDRQDFFYSVLNIPRAASQNDIRERHRALSVIFHPDKQHDEHTKDTAAKRFLEIQKAYEVLSDPFLRAVYDILGENGLKMKWPVELRSKEDEEIRNVLRRTKQFITQHEREYIIRPRGKVICGINASSLFNASTDPVDEHIMQKFVRRVNKIHVSSLATHHQVQKDFGKKTTLSLSGKAYREQLGRAGTAMGGNILGTIAHQYSPRIRFEANVAFIRPQVLNLKTTYRDGETGFFVQTHISPGFMPLLPPPFTASLSRRLFLDSSTQGTVAIHTGPRPHLTLDITSPTPFDFTWDEGSRTKPSATAGSISGFGVGSRYWSYGATFAGLHSCLKAEWGLDFTELALQAKLALEYGLTGLELIITGAWQGESSEFAASVGLNSAGILMRLDLAYLEQRLSIPVTISQDYDAALALCTAVVPSAVFILGYHFLLKPRRRAQRVAFLQAARRALDDDMATSRRETRETLALLTDIAQKRTQEENSKSGLVVKEAAYGPSEQGPEMEGLDVDVTIAVQALVHNSQLYIPGHRSKAGIQGFCDPAPSLAKSLRLRYLFRAAEHYAEIPDYLPVVLPLKEHAVLS